MADYDAPAGRGSQVIRVVLPTYIMAPTEDERCVACYLPLVTSRGGSNRS